jgi:hypothetical protein
VSVVLALVAIGFIVLMRSVATSPMP